MLEKVDSRKMGKLQQLIIVWTVCCISFCVAREFDRARSGNDGNNNAAQCQACDMRTCEIVSPESCNGIIVKDSCECCPICNYTSISSWMNEDISPALVQNDTVPDACQGITCERHEICILNIQGLPVCRCPTVYYCKTKPRRKVCSSDGETFASICLLKMRACDENRKISVAKKGACDDDASERQEERASQREERERRRLEKANQRANKQQGKKLAREKNKEIKRRQRRLEEKEVAGERVRGRDRAEPGVRRGDRRRDNKDRQAFVSNKRRNKNRNREAVTG